MIIVVKPVRVNLFQIMKGKAHHLQVECDKLGKNVVAEKFAGEGSGFTSRVNIDWKTGEDIKFTVSGQYDGVRVDEYNIFTSI